MRRGQWRPWEIALLLDMERRQVSRKEMVQRLGRSRSAIQNQLTKFNKTRPRRRRAPGSLKALVRKHWRPGLSDTDLADMLGCKCRSAIGNARRAVGIPAGMSSSERGRIGALYRWAGNRKADRVAGL